MSSHFRFDMAWVTALKLPEDIEVADFPGTQFEKRIISGLPRRLRQVFEILDKRPEGYAAARIADLEALIIENPPQSMESQPRSTGSHPLDNWRVRAREFASVCRTPCSLPMFLLLVTSNLRTCS